jgi:hypothetical protein
LRAPRVRVTRGAQIIVLGRKGCQASPSEGVEKRATKSKVTASCAMQAARVGMKNSFCRSLTSRSRPCRCSGYHAVRDFFHTLPLEDLMEPAFDLYGTQVLAQVTMADPDLQMKVYLRARIVVGGRRA